MKKTLFCVIVGYVMMLFHVQSGLCFSLVEGGSSRAVILLGDNATLVEEHAAAELTKYVKMLSGAELEVVKKPEAVRKTDVILIGRKETNPKIANLADKGLIRLSSDYPGLDGFIIKTVSMDGKNFLVIGGSEDRGTLYAVYHFLEKYAGVGFFWEGDRVPAGRDRLSVARIAVAEKPRFSSRVYMQECPFAYSTRTWDINDWIKEIDWAAKKRLNALMVPEDNWNFRVSRDEIVKEVKKRGIKPVLLGEVARFDLVTQDFMAKNPKNNYVRMRWCSDPPYYALHPGDPLFMTRGREVIKRLVQKYGSGNIGMTNVLRTLGYMPGLLTLVLDGGKGTAAVLLAKLVSDDPLVWLACGAFAIVGHNWSIFLRFQGGKGVATTAGVFLGVAPYVALALFTVFLVVVVITRYVSLGSIVAAATLPIWLVIFGFPWPGLALGTLISIFTVVRHRANIGRLLSGTEYRFGQKSR